MSDRDPTISELGRNVQDELQLRVRTVVPGVVVSYNPATQSAAVQPAPRARDRSGPSSTMLAAIADAPVVFPEGAGWSISWPLAAGDRVLLLCSDRAIDRWRQTGSPYVPSDTRKHRLTDAFVWPGAGPAPDPITGLSAVNLRIVGPGGVAIEITPAGTIELAGGGAQVARVGDTLTRSALLNTWALAVEAALAAAASPILPASSWNTQGLGGPGTLGTIETGSPLVSSG